MARNRRPAACLTCQSSRLRFSRRRYEGLASLLFQVRAVKCLSCGSYFPVAAQGSELPQFAEGPDLIFQPTEAEPRVESKSRSVKPGSAPRKPSSWLGSRCPDCGSYSSRPARAGGELSPFRLDAREIYRCTVCNGSFKRINLLRLFTLLLLLSGMLGGGAYLLNSVRVGAKADASPRIRRNQVPIVQPPVFR